MIFLALGLKSSHKRVGRGFTLVEILCVIAIITILIGLIVGAVAKSKSKARLLKTQIGVGQTNIIQMQEPGGLLSPE